MTEATSSVPPDNYVDGDTSTPNFLHHPRLTSRPSVTSSPPEFLLDRDWSFYGASTAPTESRDANGEPSPSGDQQEPSKKQKKGWIPDWFRKLLTLRVLLILGNFLIIAASIVLLAFLTYYIVLRSTASVLKILEALQAEKIISTFIELTSIIFQTNQFLSSMILLNRLPMLTNPNQASHVVFLLKQSTNTISDEIYAENLTAGLLYSGSSFSSSGPPDFAISIANDSTFSNIIYFLQNSQCAATNMSCDIATNIIDFTVSYDPFTNNDFLQASATGQPGWTFLTSLISTQSLITNFIPLFSSDDPSVIEFITGAQLRLEGISLVMNNDAQMISSNDDVRLFIVVPESLTLDSQCPTQGLLIASSNLDINPFVFLPDGSVCFPEANQVNDSITVMVSNAITAAYGSWLNVPQGTAFIQHHGYDITTDSFLPFPGFVGSDTVTWVMVVAVPESVFLSSFNTSYRIIIPIAAVLAALASVAVSIYVTRKITESLKSTIRQMTQLTQLQFETFQSEEKEEKHLQFREIKDMNVAMAIMASGLRSFSKYVPKDVVQLLVRLKREAILGVDEIELTILFSAIIDFSSITENMDPRDTVRLIRDYIEAISNIIIESKGTVDKYVFEGIMVFWNAPYSVKEHAAIGCDVALKCQQRLIELQGAWKERGLPQIRARIGLNTGFCLVGNLGSQSRLNFTCIGDNVNLASRVEGLNRVYRTEILISEKTCEQVDDLFLCRLVDRVAVKGKRKPVKVYELIEAYQFLDDTEIYTIIKFNDAMELFFRRHFGKALKGFLHYNQTHPDDPSCKQHIDLCNNFILNPPGPEWDGSIKMIEK